MMVQAEKTRKSPAKGLLLAGAMVTVLSVGTAQTAQAAVCSPAVTTNAAATNASALAKFGQTVMDITTAITSMISGASNLGSSIISSAQQTMATEVNLSDQKATNQFNNAVASAKSAVHVEYTPSMAVCAEMRKADIVAEAQKHYRAQVSARTAAGTKYITGKDASSAKGPVANVAYSFQSEYLNNGFCDPSMPLPSGMTCAKPGAWPVDADLQVDAILTENTQENPWSPRAAELFVKHAMPIPPKVPDGDQLSLPAGRAKFVAYQSWAAKAGVGNWILSSSAAMGDPKNLNSAGKNYGDYSLRKALKEMAEGTFDASNPLVGDLSPMLMSQDSEKGNIQAVAFKVGNVQGQLLWQILGKMEQIAVADAILLGDTLDKNRPSSGLTTATLKRE